MAREHGGVIELDLIVLLCERSIGECLGEHGRVGFWIWLFRGARSWVSAAVAESYRICFRFISAFSKDTSDTNKFTHLLVFSTSLLLLIYAFAQDTWGKKS